jgi:4-amino-4-deoxy-L-arabinose transferase-like glycosyltransferase
MGGILIDAPYALRVRVRDWRLLVGLTIAAAILRFATIDVQSYWFDEALTAKLVGSPFGDMLSEIPDSELTPPLYYVLAWPWAHVFGTEEGALRAFSAGIGIAVVPVAYLVGRELVSRRAGLVVAALVAFNPLLVWYSQEARPYSLLVLLGAVSLLFFARALRRGASRDLWLWALASALALLTHYFAAFLVVPEALWLAWIWQPRLRALAAGGLVAAVGTALIPLALHERSTIGTGYIEGLSLSRRAIGVPEDFLTGLVVKFDAAWEGLLDAFALAVGAAAVWLALRRTAASERRGALLAAALAVAAAGVPALLAIAGADYLNTRNVLVACVPALVVIAAGFGAARTPRPLALAGVAALCAVGVATTTVVVTDAEYRRSDFRGAAEAVGPARAPRVLVVPGVAGEVAMGQYLDGLSRVPPVGAAVAEVVVVTPRSGRLGGGRTAARPRVPPELPRPFALVERRYDEAFTLVRYRAPRPVALRSALLARVAAPIVGEATVLLQPGVSP